MKPATRYRILATAVLIVALASATGAAQFTGSLSGPVLGYVFDRDAGNLRPVRGILGSATIGAPVEAGAAASQALALSAFDFIVSTQASAELLRVKIDDGAVSVADLPGARSNPSRSVASSRGTAAALYYSDTRELRTVAGLPKEPRSSGLLEVEHPLTAMAVNDDGTLVVYAVKAPDGESVYAWTTSAGTPRFLASAGSVSGIAISASGHAILTDRDANEVFAIWNVEGGAIRRPFADVTEGVSKPSGVAAAGNRIYIANSGSANIIVLDAEGRFVKALPCNCTISGLHTFRESIYRVTDGIHQTLYLLDASSAQERILFVPPPQD